MLKEFDRCISTYILSKRLDWWDLEAAPMEQENPKFPHETGKDAGSNFSLIVLRPESSDSGGGGEGGWGEGEGGGGEGQRQAHI